MDDPTASDGEGMSPAQWQHYVNRLAAADAHARGAVYQTIPDDTHGDAGLEGFTSDGHGFQAYCPEIGKPLAQLKAALCQKITADLEKLERYRTFWEPTLKGRPLRFWRMVVPTKALKNKTVIKHAAGRAEHCTNQGLSFVDPAFQALISIPPDFVEALRTISISGLDTVTPPRVHVGDTALQAFEAERQTTIEILDGKLLCLPKLVEPANRLKFRRILLRHYLDYTNALEWIGQRDPTAREQIIAKREGLKKSIETQNLVATAQPPERLEQVRTDFKIELERVAPFIESTRRDHMSWGVVAEWLLECPLDFPQ